MKKTILLLGDITGRSRVAVRMLTDALEALGHEVLALPTALISNTLSLGAHAQLDTTQYLLDSLDTWEKLGIAYDMMMIGYVTGLEQAKHLARHADAARAKGIPVLLDPILGDNGKRYNSVTADQEAGMRLLMEHADLITPNLTEAALLGGVSDAQTEDAQDELLTALSAGKRSVLITSAKAQDGGDGIIGYDAVRGERFSIPVTRIPGSFGGTGDLFSALLMDGLLAGRTLRDAAQEAAEAVRRELEGRTERFVRI